MKRTVAFLAAIALLIGMASAASAAVTDPIVNEPGVYPIVKEPWTMTLFMESTPDILSYTDNYFTRYIENLTGITIDFKVFSDADLTTKLDLLVNSGADLPDQILIADLGATRISSYAQAGALLQQDEYFDKETGLAGAFWSRCEELGYDGEALLNQVRDPDGHLYSGTHYSVNYSDVYPRRAWINQEWLTKLNLNVPTNAEEFYQVLCAFRDNDPNGNGQKDEIPMLGADGQWHGSVVEYLSQMFVYIEDTKNGFLPLSETGGVLDVYYDKPAYQQALIYVNKLISEGLIPKSSFTDDGSQLKALAKTGIDVGVVVRGGGSAVASTKKYEPLENMVGPDGYRTTLCAAPTANPTGFITTTCEHPEAAFLFSQMFNDNPEIFLVTRFGEEGVDWDHAAEGTPSLYFEKGWNANIINYTNVWSNQNDKIWRLEAVPYLWSTTDMLEAYNGDEYDSERLNARGVMINEGYAPAWSDIVIAMRYTEDEVEEWADARTTIQNYVAEAQTLFAIGDMDPVADWDEYIQTLDSYGYKDMLLFDQMAYERAYGK